jgi:A/G-specific adenine glycosylase
MARPRVKVSKTNTKPPKRQPRRSPVTVPCEDLRPLIRPLMRWFATQARDLPWRHSGPPGRRDPYQTMVSEFMLQQTQVSRVLEKYTPFLSTFPTIDSLARAPEPAVLAAWSGLGYYRRARLLHAAAQDVVSQHAGRLPQDVKTLLTIRGIGPYTAGAIASIAFDEPAPLVDGNVSRVLMRLFAQSGRPGDKEIDRWTWQTAATLIQSLPKGSSAGACNEALMELGATVCTPKVPRCHECPLGKICRAHQGGLTADIPAPKERARRETLHLATFLIWGPAGTLMVEDRPKSGLFANLTQPPTVDFPEAPTAAELRREAERHLGTPVEALSKVESFTHTLTHRELLVTAYQAQPKRPPNMKILNRRMVRQSDLCDLPLANLHKRLLLLGFAQAATRASKGG